MFEFWRQNCVPATPNLDFEVQTYALVVKMVKIILKRDFKLSFKNLSEIPSFVAFKLV